MSVFAKFLQHVHNDRHHWAAQFDEAIKKVCNKKHKNDPMSKKRKLESDDTKSKQQRILTAAELNDTHLDPLPEYMQGKTIDLTTFDESEIFIV